MKFKTTICIIILTLTLLSCNANEESRKLDYLTAINKTTKDSTVESLSITLERGAFHYDTFTIKDSVLTFTPSQKLTPEGLLNVGKEAIYYQTLELIITNQQKKELINLINKENFWSYENEYKAKTSCTSGISISISLGEKNKKIISDDYQRDCPKGLYLLEQKLIEFSGKDLKRIYLPG